MCFGAVDNQQICYEIKAIWIVLYAYEKPSAQEKSSRTTQICGIKTKNATTTEKLSQGKNYYRNTTLCCNARIIVDDMEWIHKRRKKNTQIERISSQRARAHTPKDHKNAYYLGWLHPRWTRYFCVPIFKFRPLSFHLPSIPTVFPFALFVHYSGQLAASFISRILAEHCVYKCIYRGLFVITCM